jgi:hypothetical protein
MKYALLIYQAPNYDPKALSPDEHKQVAADYQAVNATPGTTSGPPMGLPANAITVRVKDGQVSASTGPYAGCRVALKSGKQRVGQRLLPLNVTFRRHLAGVLPSFAVQSDQLLQEDGALFQTHEARRPLRTHRVCFGVQN